MKRPGFLLTRGGGGADEEEKLGRGGGSAGLSPPANGIHCRAAAVGMKLRFLVLCFL